MPVYEYACSKCKGTFDALVRDEKKKVSCAKCGSAKVVRKYSVFGLNLGAAPEKGMSGPLCGCGAGGCAVCSAKI
jgi:putative FmdB family regulatory protein